LPYCTTWSRLAARAATALVLMIPAIAKSNIRLAQGMDNIGVPPS
jgi:hypothetical protein